VLGEAELLDEPPSPEQPDQQGGDTRRHDAEGGVAEEVEEPLRLGVMEQAVKEEEHGCASF
jgi:hypothetical protein